MLLVKTTASAKTQRHQRKQQERRTNASSLRIRSLAARHFRVRAANCAARVGEMDSNRPPPSINVSRTTPGDSPSLNKPPGSTNCQMTTHTNITDAIGVQYFKQVFIT